jgi:hypothetical protein
MKMISQNDKSIESMITRDGVWYHGWRMTVNHTLNVWISFIYLTVDIPFCISRRFWNFHRRCVSHVVFHKIVFFRDCGWRHVSRHQE